MSDYYGAYQTGMNDRNTGLLAASQGSTPWALYSSYLNGYGS